jgi:hypothetical protein
MKQVVLFSLVLALLCLPSVLAAQIVGHIVDERTPQGSYPISAHEFLWKQEQKVDAYASAHPEIFTQARLLKPGAWGFVVGSAHTWYADSLTGGASRYTVASTCRAVGTHCYIFVEDANWGGSVTQAAVDSVLDAFDNSTPANASNGIYQTDVDTFGNPPDVDNDPKIIILILDIRDGFAGSGDYVAGYFTSFNEIPKTSPEYATSNEAEIYFLDCNPVNLTTDIQVAMSTTAHEFQHMIHWNYNKLGDTFINEGCSEIASVICGYSLRDQTLFASEPNHYLFDWRRTDKNLVLNDYSRAARFMLYLKEQFGTGILKTIVSTDTTRSDRLDAALAAYSPPTARRFTDVFEDWIVANILNDTSVDPKWGYIYPGVSKVVPKIFYNPNIPLATDSVAAIGAQYLSFRNGTSLSATLTSTSPSSFRVRAVETGPSGKRVLPVVLGSPFGEPAFGTGYTDVTFVVGDIDTAGPFDIIYSSTGITSGATELKWDVLEPTGYLGNAAGDTVCVQFDGYPGGRLDSIRVALRRTGSMSGGIYRYTGTVRPTPLGTILAPISVAGTSTPASPFPVPWPNWGSADVHSLNIDATQPFAVGLACVGTFSIGNRVMVTVQPSPTYHSFTYTTGTSPNWYVLTYNTAGDSAFFYIVRAYVSIPTAIGRETVELRPSSTRLLQNYPNPFNPSTEIGYDIGERNQVTLKIFDLLGAEVTTLVNDIQEPGSYHITWNGRNSANQQVMSGAYFYRLQTGSFTRAEKMILLR